MAVFAKVLAPFSLSLAKNYVLKPACCMATLITSYKIRFVSLFVCGQLISSMKLPPDVYCICMSVSL